MLMLHFFFALFFILSSALASLLYTQASGGKHLKRASKANLSSSVSCKYTHSALKRWARHRQKIRSAMKLTVVVLDLESFVCCSFFLWLHLVAVSRLAFRIEKSLILFQSNERKKKERMKSFSSFLRQLLFSFPHRHRRRFSVLSHCMLLIIFAEA